jgi:GT2 family glycosyltransferase
MSERSTSLAPALAVVVPHYRGDVLLACVASLAADPSAPPHELVIVDDGPGDAEVLSELSSRFPHARVVKTAGRTGFGSACNAGVAASSAPLVVVLNNDVELAPGSLAAFVAAAAAHPEAALFQAKIRSLSDPRRFDYAGAAGGLVDRLGYPFAHGRLFDVVEEDRGQFDQVGEIFWACGAAMAFRRADFDAVLGFDPAFRMHMEELDLAWRLRLRGRSARLVPNAVAFHRGGYTLPARSFEKTYLNYRNNWVLLLKNLAPRSLARLVPARLALDVGTVLYGLLRRDWKTPIACLLGVLWTLLHLPQVLARRRASLRTKTATFAAAESALYPRSAVIARFLRGVRTTRALPGLAPPVPAAPAPDDRPAFSLIVPTWNEAANIGPLLRRASRALKDVPHEILIVDDGSPDGTAAVAEDLARQRYPRVRVVRRSGPRGLSAAVLDGFAAARGRTLGVMDADLQHDPRLLPDLVRRLEDHDLAVGSRYVFAGGCRGWSLLREAQSRAAASLTNRALRLGVKDPLSGYFALRRDVFERLRDRVSTDGWKILLELLAADPGLKVAEVGYVFRPRRRGHSKMRPEVVRAWLAALVRWRKARAASLRPALWSPAS